MSVNDLLPILKSLSPSDQRLVIQFLEGELLLDSLTRSSHQSEVEDEKYLSQLTREGGILVVETAPIDDFDINTFIDELREERIQEQMGL
jgi:hypothetical protein